MNCAVTGFIALLFFMGSIWGAAAAPLPVSGIINGLHFGNSQTGNSLPQNLPPEFSALGASQSYVETYLGYGTPLDQTIQPQNGKTAQGEIQSRTWSYITLQPGLADGNLYGQSQLAAASQIIQWVETNGQHPIYYVYEAWPFYSPVNGWGQASTAGPWPVGNTYSDVWNRPASTFTPGQFAANGSAFNYLKGYFDIFRQQLQTNFARKNIQIIPVGEVLAQLDAILLATNGVPTDGPTSLTGAWSFLSQDYGDGIHANALGQYIAHATTLSTITGINPHNLPIDISAYSGLTADEKSFLDGVIWNVVTSVNGVPVPTLTISRITGPAGGQFTLSGSTDKAGQVVTEKATSLTPPVSWTPMATNAVSGGAFSFPIPQGAEPQAFYRLMGQ